MSPSTSASPTGTRAIVGQLLHLAWPILIAQLLSMTMMVADTVIAGRYGTADLAGVAIGSSYYISVVMLLTGTLQAISPTIAHHVGAGRQEAIAPALQQGFWLALLLTGPGIALLLNPGFLLEAASVPPAVAAKAADYLAATAFGLPALLLYRSFYAFNNAVGRPRVLMAISAITMSVHIPLAWALTNGALGFAPMGGTGCGVSTATVHWIALGCGFAYLVFNPAYKPYRLFHAWQAPRAQALGQLLRLGLPMGVSTFIDISSFTLIAILAARLGTETVAGHRVIANFTGMIYMLPLSLSIATMVLVGQSAGAQDWRRARRTARLGMSLALGFSLLVGALLWMLREPLVAFSSADPAVQAVALGLVVWLLLYQCFDALQTVAAHALRGYKVTLLPMLVHSLCFWGIGLAGGYWLSFHAPWRASAPTVAGFWEACVLATLAATLLFGALLRAVSRRHVREATVQERREARMRRW